MHKQEKYFCGTKKEAISVIKKADIIVAGGGGFVANHEQVSTGACIYIEHAVDIDAVILVRRELEHHPGDEQIDRVCLEFLADMTCG